MSMAASTSFVLPVYLVALRRLVLVQISAWPAMIWKRGSGRVQQGGDWLPLSEGGVTQRQGALPEHVVPAEAAPCIAGRAAVQARRQVLCASAGCHAAERWWRAGVCPLGAPRAMASNDTCGCGVAVVLLAVGGRPTCASMTFSCKRPLWRRFSNCNR